MGDVYSYPTLNLYKLTADKTLWNDKKEFLVLAESEEQAKNCLTFGSDSVWVSVASCEKVKSLYGNCGAFILE